MSPANSVNRALFTIFLAVAVAGAVVTRLNVDWHSFLPAALPALLIGVMAAYCEVRQMPTLGRVAESFVLILGALCLGMLLSYEAARSAAPMADASLFAADRALGFDWWRYIRFFNAHPAFALAMHVVYISMLPQVIFIGVLLSGMPGGALGQRFVGALMLALMLTSAISVLTPAVGIYGLLHVDLQQFPNLFPATRFQAVEPLAELRSGTFQQFRLRDSVGIISFPSFHCAAAILLIWAASHLGRWKWPLIAVNIAMIASTPVEGAHYLVDVLAGMGVAVVALLVADWLHRRARVFGTLPARRSASFGLASTG